jgi:hypothetical protein
MKPIVEKLNTDDKILIAAYHGRRSRKSSCELAAAKSEFAALEVVSRHMVEVCYTSAKQVFLNKNGFI